MKTFWLKIAGFALVVVVAIVLIGNFTSRNSEPPQPSETPQTKQRTFYDKVEEDKEKFLAEPQSVKESEPDKRQQQQKPTEENRIPAETAKPTVLYFKPLDEIEKVEAEKLLNEGAVPGRSIGRLPWTGYKLMVDACRRIISKWPESWYAYRAKQILADMPERFRPRYKITAQELDVSKFAEKRPGTEPFTVEDYPSND
jgi:hypothetical protein